MAELALLRLDGVTKRYGALVANDDIHLEIGRGEVLGILGENGAGKSTLMNIISGLIRADEGRVFWDGQAVSFGSPRAAAQAGIGMVHQHFKLVEALTVAENLALGEPAWGRRPVLRLEHMKRAVGAIAQRLGISLDFDARIDRLSVGEQQRVEIIKVLARRPRLLILDEPTAVLSQEERPALFRIVAELSAQGTAVVIISHKLEDILESCRRVVVMRHGKVVNTSEVGGKSREDLVRLLVGDELPAVAARQAPSATGPCLMQVSDLTLKRPNGTVAVSGVSFDLRRGEILALCGVEGNGQSELVQAVSGLRKPDGGRISYWFGKEGRHPDAGMLRRAGVCHIPEDRLKEGVVGGASLGENFLLTHLSNRRFNRRGWIRPAAIRAAVREAIAEYSIKTPGIDASIAQLSGGNQQKLVLARELAGAPELIVAAHPTRGLDIKTIAFINNKLVAQREAGAGVLLASADLAEVWQVADRVMVLSAGRLYGPVRVADTSLQDVGKWMTQS